jgi:hypothetical protein
MALKCDLCDSELFDGERIFYVSTGFTDSEIAEDQRLLLFCKKCFSKIIFSKIPRQEENK